MLCGRKFCPFVLAIIGSGLIFVSGAYMETLTFATAEGIHWIFSVFLVLLLLDFIFQIAAFHKASVK